MPKAKHKRIVVMGVNESGKSHWVKQYLKGKKALVWDPNNEYDAPRKRVPNDQTSMEELDKFMEACLEYYRDCYLVVDETHNVLPNHIKDPLGNIKEMLYRGRHSGFDQIYICLRPSLVCPSIIQLAHELIIFEMHGDLDIKRLNGIHAGMGDAADKLPLYHYIHFTGKGYKIKKPIGGKKK